MNAREIDELFARALSGDYEDEAPWEAVHALRLIGTREVLEKATEWCKSEDPLVRARGADVIAQLGKTTDHPRNSFPEESYAVVTGLLQREEEPEPLAAAITGLGHLDNPHAVPLVVKFLSHPSRDVRFSVAFALGCFPNDPLSSASLTQLMQDKEEDVRDWATFGLGVLGDTDSTELREALLRCLDDPNKDVREEAIVGLAKRKDQRVLSVLLPALERPEITDRIIEAGYLLLDMESEPEGWKGVDYATALRERFHM